MGQTVLSDNLRDIEAEIAAGRPEQALTLCQEVQARYPRALAVQRVLGEVYLALRKTREALGALDRALAGNPEDARACCARAIVHQIHGDPMAALAWYRRACDITPDDKVLRAAYQELATPLSQPAYRPSRMGLARLYLRGDLFHHAIREWETLIAEQPDALEAQLGLAETFWRAHRFREAEERCRRILTNAASCVKALLMLAAIEHDAGHAEEAQRLVRRSFELDPDQRIARVLFADRFAAGDHALRAAMLLGEEPAQPPRPTHSSTASLSTAPVSGPSAPRSRPFTHSQPISQPPERPQVVPSQPIQQHATSTPLRPEVGIPAPAARNSALPEDFHKIFAETENMLWGADNHDAHNAHTDTHAHETKPAPQQAIEPAPQRAPNTQNNLDHSRGDPFARSSVFVPPVMRDQGTTFDETEARAAINWINWLQAQGAVPHEAISGQLAPPQAARPTGPIILPAPMPPMPPMPPSQLMGTQLPMTQPPDPYGSSPRTREWPQPAQASAPQPRTGPLSPMPPTPAEAPPTPTPEALRAMFAELEPEASNRRIVEGAIVDTSSSAASPHVGEEVAQTTSALYHDDRDDIVDTEPVESDAFASSSSLPIVGGAGDIGYETGEAAPDTALLDEPPHWSDAAASAAGRTLNPDVAADLPQDIADLYGVTAEGGSPLPQVSSLEPEIERPEAASPWHAPTPDVSEFDTGELMIPTASDKPEPPIVPVTTLEALELNFATSGFQHIELRPGELETLVDQTPTDKQTAQPRPVEAQSTLPEPPITEWQVSTAASVEHPTGQANGHTTAAPLADAPVPAVPVTTPASSAPMPARSAEPEPAHDDYPARLDLARRRRDAGRLDDALTEYRVILRNAPDLLADVIGDLNKLMEDAPEHPEVHRLLGDARIRQGDYLSALESYNRAVSLTQARSE